MKKVINNKLYDTETAKKRGYTSYSNRSDFHFWEETLYQKKTGEFFLYGFGGAASRYAESCGQNEWCSGEKIIPLSFEKAREWAEENLDGDDYLEIFGEPEEDDTKQQLCIYLRKDTIEKLKRQSAEQSITVSEVIERLVK